MKLRQALYATKRGVHALIGRDLTTGLKLWNYPTTKLGSEYGGWYVPTSLLGEGSVCYCVGAGEDITFDLELLHRGCSVYTFDPTPRAIEYVTKVGGVTFFPYGVWSENTTQRFYTPKNEEHVSHSIMNLQKTDTYFDAECKTVTELMRMNGHATLTLLKLDIEGAEHAVVSSVLSAKIPVTIFCIEFDEMRGAPSAGKKARVRGTAHALSEAGYRLIKVDGLNFTFLHTSAML